MAGFGGFRPAAFAFLRDLSRNNEKVWFEANRDVYEREVREPMRRLVAALPRNARVVNIDWDEKTEFGPPPRRRVPRARFLRDARRAGLRLVADRRLLPHQYFLVLRRAR